MSALIHYPHQVGRRLAGAMLSAIATTAVAMPLAIWITGLVLGPAALREKIIITTTSFSAVYGRASMLAVMAGTFVLFILLNLIFGQRPGYARGTALPALFDDSLTVRSKLTVLLSSAWGWVTIALNLFWIGMALPFRP